ncbi:MAG: DUF2207 domain-containing protein, partial [Bauldia litoralis]
MKTLAACLAAALLLVAAPAFADEVIERFDAEIVVQPDGVLAVTETIRVKAEGDQIRRGIFRDFPLTFVDAEDRVRSVTFSIEDVTRDGEPEPYHTARNNEGIRIYIGEQDVL